MDDIVAKDQKSSLEFSSHSLSFALLFSNGSVLLIGILLIVRGVVSSSTYEYKMFNDSTTKK